jgi:hypothetical protein
MVRTRQPPAAEPAAKTLAQEIKSLADDLARSGGTAAERNALATRLKTLATRADTAQPSPGTRMVAPPRKRIPDFARGGGTPQTVDLGAERKLKIGARALSIGIPGLFEIDADEGGVSISTPVGGVSIDEDGIAVESGGGGVHVGKDGAGVRHPNGAGVEIGKDGKVEVTPPRNPSESLPWFPGAGKDPPSVPSLPGFGTAPFDIPIPVPRFISQPFDIHVQIPRIVADTFSIPLPFPRPFPDFFPVAIPFPSFGKDPPSWPAPEPPAEPIREPVLADPLAKAIAAAIETWRPLARMRGLRVEGALALGEPGCLNGPDIEPLIEAEVGIAGLQGDDQDFAKAVAKTVAEAFADWRDGVMVPGLPWYPAFTLWPAPVAPPMPNVPSPLASLPSSGTALMTRSSHLDSLIRTRLSAELDRSTRDRRKALAREIAIYFEAWLASHQVMRVMGQGPVPGFDPMLPKPVAGGTAESPGACLF